MIQGLALLVAGQMVGEAVAQVAHLPVPGPVVGMGLVLLVLMARKGQLPELRRGGSAMLLLVPLFLVPVSVGIMDQADALRADAVPLLVAMLVSIVLGMAATALTIRWARRFDAPRQPAQGEGGEGGGA